MSYIINGPVILGDTLDSTTIYGNIFAPDLATGTGDLIYCSNGGAGVLSRLGIGSNGQVLTLAGGIPSWATAAGSGKSAFFGQCVMNTITSNRYISIMDTIFFSSSITTDIISIFPCNGIFNNLYVARYSSDTVDITITLYKNGVATALSAVILSGNNTGNDTVNSVTIVAGDLVCYSIVGNANSNTRNYKMSVVFTAS